MTNCKEFFLDDVIAVTAIPIADFRVGGAVWQLAPIIPINRFTPTLTSSITIGLQSAVPGAALIPIMRRSGKVKDEESDSVAGRLHTVTVNCEIDDRDPLIWGDVRTLECTPSHLLLTFRDKSRAFVKSSEDTYHCTVNRDGSKATVAIRVQCIMGVQMLV